MERMPLIMMSALLAAVPAMASLRYPVETARISVAPPAMPEQHFLTTACTELSPRGRSVIHSRLVDDPGRACQSMNGPHTHFSCASDGEGPLDAYGTVQVTGEKGTVLWSCVVQDNVAIR